MRPVKLIADSSCDIGPELAERYNVDFVHIHVRLNGQEYLDGVNITHKEIYQNYDERHTLPSTAAMNIDEYEAVFRPFIEQGYDIVHVSLGSGLSSTCNNARLAGEQFEPGRVWVIDSKSLSTGSGHIVCECGERIKKGMDAKQVFEEVSPIADRVSASFILDDLEYLHAGGRCSGLEPSYCSLSCPVHSHRVWIPWLPVFTSRRFNVACMLLFSFQDALGYFSYCPSYTSRREPPVLLTFYQSVIIFIYDAQLTEEWVGR